MDAGSSSAHAAGSTRDRPTPAEEQEALSIIDQMRKMDPPLVTRMGQPPKPNVVACAIALSRKEQFKRGDAEAKERFGVAPNTDVRGVWVEGKLATFAPAGFAPVGHGGPPLPTFLLDRLDHGGAAASSGDAGLPPHWWAMGYVPTYVDVAALRARYKDWDDEAEMWLCEHLKAMAQREREWVGWAAKHDGEREAQLAALAEAEPLYFWALEHALNQKPKWVLRKGEWLETDSARTLGENQLRVEEPLSMYRAFEPFVGDASAAATRFGDPYSRANKNWERRERAALEAQLAARGAEHLCTGNCPLPSDDEQTAESGEELCEPEQSSADCFYEGAAAHERLAEAERLKRRVERDEVDECDGDRVLHDDARRSIFYGTPAANLQPGLAAPRDWSEADVLHAREVEREERRCLDRAAREGFPPPHRSDEKYGSQVQNPDGDDCFRHDRRVWYEQVTGDSLEDVRLSEQWRICDTLARRYRTY